MTRLSPFSVIYQRTPCLPCDKVFADFDMILSPLIQNPLPVAIENTNKFRANLKSKYDLKHPNHPFEIGDVVLLCVTIRKIGQIAKFFPN